MSKKIWIPIAAILLVSLTAGGWLYTRAGAQEPQARLRRLPGALGQVTAVEADQFTLQSRAGQEHTFRFDESTRFTNPEKEELSTADLRTGGWVRVMAARRGEQPRLARAVVILPADFDPEDYAGLRGRVTSVDVSANAFTLEDKDGQATSLKVDANTVYRGQVTALADLQVDMQAQVVTKKQTNGDLLAVTVRAGSVADQRYLGKVTAVGTESFTIQTRKGETLTFQVTAETVYHSRTGLVDSLDDLKAGMPVAVGANDLGDGRYQALRVLAAPGPSK